MKKNIFICTLLSAFATLFSCESVLDKTDLSGISPNYVYSDTTGANLVLNYIYDQNLPNAWEGPTLVSGLGGAKYSDESMNISSTEDKVIEGTLIESSTPVTDFGTALSSTNNYGKIRTINDFIESLDASSLDLGGKNRLKAQALFFRAWRYFELVKLYGGVPLILNAQDAVGNEALALTFLPRNSTTECMNQINADLDTAAKYLPSVWPSPSTNWGKITKGAALAFKGKVQLYSASPQFNPNQIASKWQAAYDANKAALTSLTSSGATLIADYGKIWFTESGNTEAVMVVGFNNSSAAQGSKNNGWEKSCRPKYAADAASGSNQPTWDIVKAYPMKDGKKPGDPTSTYTYSDLLFYKNRDPRFEKTIAYNGCTWPMTNLPNNRLWTYKLTATSTTSVENGGVNTGTTGFYCRKGLQTSDVASATIDYVNAKYSGTDWIEIRLAEVMLNLAEAATGINKLDEAYPQLIAIRKRAGIEAGSNGLYGLKANMTQAEMFQAILDERQIEFAFEGKRFWDLRRWKKLESVMNGNKGTKVVIAVKTGKTAPTANDLAGNIDDLYNNFFTVTTTANSLGTRVPNYSAKQYFFPIPTAALNNSVKLTQNNNWGGTFDPLQ